jgi:hypothetical protein
MSCTIIYIENIATKNHFSSQPGIMGKEIRWYIPIDKNKKLLGSNFWPTIKQATSTNILLRRKTLRSNCLMIVGIFEDSKGKLKTIANKNQQKDNMPKGRQNLSRLFVVIFYNM